MSRFTVFVICFVAAVYFVECSTVPQTFGSNIEVNEFESLAEFLEANPGVRVQRLDKEESFDEASNRIQLIHKLGNRINGEQRRHNSQLD